MILLINTIITNDPIPGTNTVVSKNKNRTHLKSYTPYEVFKYSLLSLSSAHKWSKAILKISLSEEYACFKDELTQFIHDKFKNTPLVLSWERNIFQKDWQETYDLLDDELIFFSCNHDHIFLDSSPDYLNSITNEMYKECDGYISSCYTHWPENISYISKNGFKGNDINTYENYATVIFPNTNVDSINIISKKLYHTWWFSTKLPEELWFPRPDWKNNMLSWFVKIPNQKNFIQYKELCRHFDAYYHLDMNQCPALNIPDGIFDNNIKISIGNSNRIDGYTWFNPQIKLYIAETSNGVDYKWLEEDIPIGWKPHVSEIKTEPFNLDTIIHYRIQSITDMLFNTYSDPMIFETNVLNSILNVWLKPYGLII